MSSMTIFIIFVSIIALLFLFINLIFAPHNPYQEKDSMFECGFHSFQQSRSPFNIAFFIYALVYLLLDLEILLIFPFAVSGYVNNFYGLIITLLFILILCIGFVFELGKGALKIPSKQHNTYYTTKNLPRIEISHINIKPHIFITSSPLQSRIFSFYKHIKNINRYLNYRNFFTGLICLVLMIVVKRIGISEYILDLIGLEYQDLLLNLITGFLGLMPLGIKNIFDAYDNYTMMGEDPTQGDNNSPVSGSDSESESKSKTGATNTSDLPYKQGSAGGITEPESKSLSSDSTSQKEDSSKVDTDRQESSSEKGKNYTYTAERLAKVFDNSVATLIEDVKKLSIDMEKTTDDKA